MAKMYLADLVCKKQLTQDIFLFSIKAEELSKEAKPGHFLEIRVTDQVEPFLRRPISIYEVEEEKGTISFLFQVKGKGTKILSQKQEGDKIDLLGPLGNGTFEYERYSKIALLGGGIGVFPLYELAKRASKMGKNVSTYLGFQTKKRVILEQEFQTVSDTLVIATDDGSYGEKGFAIDQLKKQKGYDCIYACGPLPMLKAVKQYAVEEKIPCQISLEERMGCGLGACLGCAIKVAGKEEYWHVCKAGPVFDAKLIEI